MPRAGVPKRWTVRAIGVERGRGSEQMAMRTGIIVLNVFAALWGGAAIVAAHRPLWLIALPVLVSAGMIGWAGRALRHVGARPDAARVGRLVGIWSAVEGVAILIAVNVLNAIGRGDAIGPAIAIIVGLHFLPLARGIPVRLYYATGGGIVLAGALALVLPPGERLPAIGLAAALILWISAATIILRGRTASGAAA